MAEIKGKNGSELRERLEDIHKKLKTFIIADESCLVLDKYEMKDISEFMDDFLYD